MTDLSSDILLLDGPTGTELERRGFRLRTPLWSAGVLDADPDFLLGIHREYVAAGADILTANTFRTNPNSLRRAGTDPGEALRLTTAAVDLARRAVDLEPRLVAGSVAPVGDCYTPGDRRSETFLSDDHRVHIGNIVAADPDLLLLETMNSLPEALLATRLALEHPLPVFVSLVTDRTGTRLLDRTDLAAAVSQLAALGPDGILLNCASPAATATGVTIVAKVREESGWSFRYGGYPNSGDPDPEKGWDRVREVADEDFDGEVLRILDAGGGIIGSCCGTTPATTTRLRRLVDSFRPRM